ncbi:MAG: 50S ribosomal protein L17 [Flavobacteriales bacterium]|jgi:large subunit ribosomal protein L17|nr:50S ribosomal protein L17 [Flavobacteriales bacterium]
MRHGKKNNHLGRTAAHRKAMLSNMAGSLILHKRINTTVAKAKELRKYVEPLITKAKTDTTHSRRIVFSYLKQKEVMKALFGEVVNKVADRPGGYTRIIKTGFRQGDGAEMCMVELVDFNEIYTSGTEKEEKKTRRSRRSKKDNTATTEAPVEAVEETKAEETSADESTEEKDA